MLARRGLAVLLAVTLAPQTAVAASTCPNERPGASDSDNLRSCLEDAREARKAGEARLSSAAYGRAVEYARRAYAAGKTGATAPWFTGSGEQLVYYGTEGCGLGGDLGPAEARVVYDACIGLLETYVADLTAISAQGSRSGQVMQKRLEEVKALRDALPAPAPEPSPVVVDPPAPAPVVEQPPAQTVAPTVTPDEPPRPAPRPPPRGLQIGFGVSLGLAALSVVGLAGAGVSGRRAAAALVADNDAPGGQPICDTQPAPEGCGDLAAAKQLYVASGVGLGVGLVAAVVFGALWARDSRSRRPTVSVAPRRGGLSVGLTLRF